MRLTRRSALVPLVLTIGAVVALSPSPAGAGGAGEAVVTIADDVVDAGDGETSLREAVTEVNLSGVAGVIFLLPGVEHELTRCGGADDTNAQGDLDLTGIGPGTTQVIGEGATIRQTCPGERVLDVDAYTLFLSDLTITGGDVTGAEPDGGGVRADLGYTMLLDGTVRILDNEAGGLGGGLYVDGSLGNGGHLTIADNQADSSGGGAYATGNIGLDHTTVSGNSADGFGGGLRSETGFVSLEDSTLADNFATEGGAAAQSGEHLGITRSTVIDNTTGDAGQASLQAGTTIVLDQSVAGFIGDPDGTVTCGGTLDGAAFAFITDESCGLPSGDGNVEGGSPMLGPLADNGGPTLTMEPAAGSPLRDAVPFDTDDSWCDPDADPPPDQRTVPRIFGERPCDIGAVETPVPFTDVPDTHPFFEDVNDLIHYGITTGFPDGTYRPSASVTRQAIAAFLFRLADVDDHSPGPPTFSDVPANHPFFTEIDWLVSEEITTGFPNGTFRPGGVVTRQAIAAFLYRLAGATDDGPPTPTFSDVGIGHPFYDEIEWLADEGLSTGFPNGTFRPSATMTRQAMAAFLSRNIAAGVIMI